VSRLLTAREVAVTRDQLALFDIDWREAERAYYFRMGRYYGYPECCIAAFVDDVAAGRHPAVLRGNATPGGWVPCPACREEPAKEMRS
jgi:hypothetical protein